MLHVRKSMLQVIKLQNNNDTDQIAQYFPTKEE